MNGSYLINIDKFNMLHKCCTPFSIMQAVLGQVRRALAYKRAMGKSFATAVGGSEGVANRKLYELRTYSIKPARYAEFLKLSNEYMHLRMAHSKLVGYWTTELGGLNEVVHIWEYDSFSHRTLVRKALPGDKNWMEMFISKILPMLSAQYNAVMYLAPWFEQKLSSEKSFGAYELVTHTVQPGMLPQYEHRMLQGLPARLAMDYPKPIGIWYSDIGAGSTVYQLWPHESQDKRAEHQIQLVQNEVWRGTSHDVMKFVQSIYVKILVPVPFSPLK